MGERITVSESLTELIEKGNYLQAIDIGYMELKKNESQDVRKNLALALSRSGSTDRAMEVLSPLLEKDEIDPETRSLSGGILKRQWEITGSRSVLETSFENYLRAFREGGEYWAGINAATLAFVMDMEIASVLADEVLDICWEEYGRMGTRSSFWLLVSIAEGHLVKGDLKTAMKWYKLVTPMSYKSVGKIRTVRRNARMLGKKFGDEALVEIRSSIHTPKIAFFAGHKIDRKGMLPRFPQQDTDSVKKKLRAALGRYRISVGVASLADGSDILFHECLIEAGRQSRVVFPSPVPDFRARLAADDPGGWLERFDAVLEKASAVEVVSRATFEDYGEDTYELTTDFMIGYSLNLAEELDGEMVPLVAWDKQIQERKGGTYSAVSKLRKLGIEPEIVQIIPSSEGTLTNSRQDSSPLSPEREPFRCSIVVAGIESQTSDQEKARMISELMGTVKDIVRRSSYSVLKKSLGYDEVYLIFQDVSDAESFVADLISVCSHCTVTAHVDFSLMFEDGPHSSRQIFSPALADIVSINRMISSGDVFCTTGFRSLARFKGLDNFTYRYAGSYAVTDTHQLNLFRMQQRTTT